MFSRINYHDVHNKIIIETVFKKKIEFSLIDKSAYIDMKNSFVALMGK